MTPVSLQDTLRMSLYNDDLLEGQTRILEMKPGSEGQAMYRLEVGDMDKLPQYKALSYRWDKSRKKEKIKINDIEHEIYPNLLEFLNQMHSLRQFGNFWIDALCIDQNNDKERASQVSRMDHIYRNAQEVVVWLGSRVDGSHEAMAMEWVKLQSYKTVYASYNDEAPCPLSVVRGIEGLCNRSYWTRFWVQQEFALPDSITIYCGPDCVTWEQFDAALDRVRNFTLLDKVEDHSRSTKDWPDFLVDKEKYRKHAAHTTLNTRALYRLLYCWTGGFALPELLRLNFPLSCDDPRDSVYALLGLRSQFDKDTRSACIVPDYNKSMSVERLFIQLANMLANEYTFVDAIPRILNVYRRFSDRYTFAEPRYELLNDLNFNDKNLQAEFGVEFKKQIIEDDH